MKLTKDQIAKLKESVTEYALSLGGAVARITYHKQNQYARGFICCYCDNRSIGEIRVYATGARYAFTVPEQASRPQEIVARDHEGPAVTWETL